jgi:4'-phosphopantetheinyl transferase EntD
VGSITHCHGYCAAVVAYRDEVLGLGIDAERNVPLVTDLHGHVCTPGELRDLHRRGITADLLGADPTMLVFSAKESIYKAWYPITGAWLGFENAAIELDVRRRRFSVRLDLSISKNPLVGHIAFSGVFSVTREYIFTLVVAAQWGNHVNPCL